jgi:hypothetical protein
MNTVRCEKQRLSGTEKGISESTETVEGKNISIMDLYKSISELNNSY